MNFTIPFLFVFLVSNGVPGIGLEVDRGVDISTGTSGLGVPRIVTSMVASLIDGSGEGEPEGVGEVAGMELLLWQAAIAKEARARTIIRRLGMVDWSSTPYADAPLAALQRPK